MGCKEGPESATAVTGSPGGAAESPGRFACSEWPAPPLQRVYGSHWRWTGVARRPQRCRNISFLQWSVLHRRQAAARVGWCSAARLGGSGWRHSARAHPRTLHHRIPATARGAYGALSRILIVAGGVPTSFVALPLAPAAAILPRSASQSPPLLPRRRPRPDRDDHTTMAADAEHGLPPDDAAAEKRLGGHHHQPPLRAPGDDASSTSSTSSPSLIHKVLRMGRVEENGIRPLPLDQRTNTRFFNIFTVWFSINSNILGITFGMLGPAVYGLSLRDSSLVILFFSLLSTLAPGALAVLGPKTGMRQMIQARYSFGCVFPRQSLDLERRHGS